MSFFNADIKTKELECNGDINLNGSIIFEGSSPDDFETTLTVTDPTADRTITLPNVTGTAITSGNLSDITSTGTLSTLTVDNVNINGNTIGHTSDTNLLTLTNGLLTVDGEISVTTLDIGGTNVTSSATELNLLSGITEIISLANAGDILQVGTNGSSIASSNLLNIDTSNGRLGIGTSSPQRTLHLVGDLQYEGSMRIDQYHTSEDGPDIIFNKGRGTPGSTTTVVANDEIMKFSGKLHNGVDFQERVKIQALATVDGSQYGSKLELMTGKNASPSVRITIDENGNTTFADGSIDVDIASHNGTNGLKLEGTLVTSSAAEINKLNALSRGSIIYGNSSGATAILTKGSSNQVLTSDGTDISWSDPSSGGVTISNNANNRVLTGDGSDANAESNLTFDGTDLTIANQGKINFEDANKYIHRNSSDNLEINSDTRIDIKTGSRDILFYDSSTLYANITNSGVGNDGLVIRSRRDNANFIIKGTYGNSTVNLMAFVMTDGDTYETNNIKDTAFAGRPEKTTGYGSGWYSGLSGTPYSVSNIKMGHEIVTYISLDIEGQYWKDPDTGQSNDISIIGESTNSGTSGESNAYFYQIDEGVNGKIYKAELICIEEPASSGTVADDIGIHIDTSIKSSFVGVDDMTDDFLISPSTVIYGTLLQSSAIDTIGSSGNINNYYLYLVGRLSFGNGVATGSAFSAGKFMIKLYGIRPFKYKKNEN